MDGILLSLLGFSVAMYITPGPNNVMVAASAANHGIRATMPHMLGIATGFCGDADPGLRRPRFGACELAIAAAAVPLGRRRVAACARVADCPCAATGRRRQAPRARLHRGGRHSSGSIPKAWLIAVGAAGEYLSPNQPLVLQLARIFVVFLAVGMPCLMVWALLGSGAGRLLHSPARLRAFNVAMALLLVASLVPVLIEG